MYKDEIVTALRCCASQEADCKGNCAFFGTSSPNEYCSQKKNTAAADLIEELMQEIEALWQEADEGLRLKLTAQKSDEIYRAALEAFGARAQVLMAIEEMSELTKELCKNDRGRENVTHIAEEIADVEIMLGQMKILFDCTGAVDKFRRYKLNRLARRIEEAK